MGCHTWFYRYHKKINEYSYKQEKFNTVNIFYKTYLKYLKLKNFYNLDIYSDYYFSDYSDVSNNFKYIIKKTINNKYTLTQLIKFNYDDIYIRQGVVYKDVDDFGDEFRTRHYPRVNLMNLRQTLKFCNKRNIELDDVQLFRLEKFWEKYPRGLIRFG